MSGAVCPGFEKKGGHLGRVRVSVRVRSRVLRNEFLRVTVRVRFVRVRFVRVRVRTRAM